MKFMRYLCLVAVTLIVYAQDSRPAYGDAVHDWNAGRIAESRNKLAALIERDPGYFGAYELYWNAIARTTGEESQRAAAAQVVGRFASVPPEKRTEDFYDAYENGLTILHRDADAKRVNAECIARYPRGLTAQQALLHAARDERDSRRAAGLLESYLNRFDDNISWTELAARDRFLLILAHRDQFDSRALIDAAAKWESRERAFIKTFGNPERYVMTAVEISKALIDIDAAAALHYATVGVEFDATAQVRFWPVMLQAQTKLGQWPEAVETGAKAIQSIESGKMFARLSQILDESKLRRSYGEALDRIKKVEEARLQFSIAAQLSDDAKPAFNAYLMAHPISETELAELRARGADKISAERDFRIGHAKSDLLASETKKPAQPFRLKNLEGHDVALADLHGKIVIAPFWATWCGPCLQELETLNKTYPRLHGSAEVLAISIDDTISVVKDFVKKQGYVFPILKSDGSVESAYATAATLEGINIPQLYIIDGEGNIRFHLTGFEDDGLFDQRLDWMIAAALK